MNPRQRRGALLLIASVVAAIAVFISVLAFIADVNSRAGNFIQIVALSRDVKAYQPITPEDVALKEIPEKWASGGAVRDGRPASTGPERRAPRRSLPRGMTAPGRGSGLAPDRHAAVRWRSA